MKILLIETSPRGEQSVSRKLTQAIVDKIQAKYPGSSVKNRDLTVNPLPHLDPVPENHTDHDKRAIRDSDEVTDEVLAADAIVIGVPMWNFGIPSVLKAWIDHLARAGRTFSYGAKGPEGLVKGKHVYLALATGGVYSEGPAKGMDFIDPYLRAILGFLGMTDITTLRAEGVAIPGIQEKALEKAIQSIQIR